MPDNIRRRGDADNDPGGITQDPDLMPPLREGDEVAGVSPLADGGNSDHPINDEDFNDEFGSDDYEDLIDETERADPETVEDDEPVVE